MFRSIYLAAVLMGLGAPAAAHHAASAFFGGENVLIKGELAGVRLVNPHSYFRVKTDDGEDWLIESQQSAAQLAREGYTAELFELGQRVAFSGEANNSGRKHARWRTLTLFSEGEDGPVSVYLLGRMPRTDWVAYVREQAVPCGNGIEACYSVSEALRAEIDAQFGGAHSLW